MVRNAWLRALSPAWLTAGVLLSGCPRPGLAPDDETTTDTTTTTSMSTSSDTTTSSNDTTTTTTTSTSDTTTTTTTTTDTSTTTTTSGEPVIFVTIAKPGVDAGSSVAITSGGQVLWAGVQGPTGLEADGFVKLVQMDGTESWSYEGQQGPGFQQVFQAVQSGALLFGVGTGVPAGGAEKDGFLVQLSSGGAENKVSVVSSAAEDRITAVAPASDVNGGVFVAGTLGGTSLVPEAGGATFGGPDDLFVMLVDKFGFGSWRMVCAGTAPASSARALVRDAASGTLYLGLVVAGALDVPRTDGALEIKPAVGDPSDGAVYVVDEGQPASAPVTNHLLFRSAGADTIEAIAKDVDGTFYVAGTYKGPELKVNGVSLVQGNSDGQIEGFVARMDAAGTVKWKQRFSGNGNQRIHALALGGGSLVIAGSLDDDGVLGAAQVPHTSGVDFVVARLDSETGEVLSVQVSDGTGNEWPAGIAVDGDGGAWITGDFSTAFSFAGKQATANGDFDAFLLRLPP